MLRVTPNKHVNIGFGGGGYCGLSYAGALKRLGDAPNFSFDDIKRAAGVSIGCIAALAICLRLKPEEMFNRLGALDFKKIIEYSYPWNMVGKKAIFNGNYIYYKLKKLLSDYTGRSDPQNITFDDFKKAGFKDLYIVTSEFYEIGNEIHAFEKIHSFEHTPNGKIIKAIMSSIAIPLLFRAISFDGALNFDGGIANNLPYQLFHARKYLPTAHPLYNPNDSTFIKNPHTLAIAIAPFDPNLPRIPLKKINFFGVAQGTLNGLLKRGYDLTIESQGDQCSIISIPRKITLIDFGITKEKKQEVLHAGAQAVSKAFNLEDVTLDYCSLPEKVDRKNCWAKLFGTNTSPTKPPILSLRLTEQSKIFRASF